MFNVYKVTEGVNMRQEWRDNDGVPFESLCDEWSGDFEIVESATIVFTRKS